MNEEGKYIYGIINSNTHGSLESYDIEDKKAYSIPYKDISVIVSNEEIVDYTHMHRDVLARLLVRHQKVIEKIMSLGYTIIPLRLGTFAIDKADAKDILNKGYILIKDIFKKMRGKIEIDVVCTWSDLTLVLKELNEEKEIKEYREMLIARSKGITVDDQMKVGFMLKKALDDKRERYAFKIQSALKNVSHDLKIHELMDDKMIINSAFLINKDSQKEFDRKIESLNNEFAEKLNFRCVGPLPPYSFYTLEIEKMQFKDVDWARKKLGLLNDFSTKDEIKKAYRSRASSSHPDKYPDTPGMEREFNEIKMAYKTLVKYYEACKQANKTEVCYFKEEEFKKNSVLVRIRK